MIRPTAQRVSAATARVLHILLMPLSRVGRLVSDELVDRVRNQSREVWHIGVALRLTTPNNVTYFRARTFAEKEPETLEWIDSFPLDSVFWDVGANVGLYSIYAALRRRCSVYAFEPSVFNLEWLARNIFLNRVGDRVCIVPLPLNDALGANRLNLTSTAWGGALSTFGHAFGWDGAPLAPKISFRTLGLTMDDAVSRLGIPKPDFIKLDVDGIEHLILGSGPKLLQDVKGVLVEVTEGFAAQSEGTAKALRQAGLTLVAKVHSDMIEHSDYGNSFNQVWARIRG